MKMTNPAIPRLHLVLSMACVSLTAVLWCACSSSSSAEGNRASPGQAAAPSGPAAAPGGPPSRPRAPDEDHVVFSLLDNRALGHAIRDGGLFIPAGEPGVAKYLNFRRPWRTWKLNKTVEGRGVALAIRTVSWLGFPLSDEQAAATRFLSLSINSPRGQGLRLKLNGRALESLSLKQGWQAASVALPAGVARAGENRLELGWGATGKLEGHRAQAALQWLQIGERKLESEAVPALHTGAGLHLPAGGGLAYYILPYKGTRVRLRLPPSIPERCTISISLTSSGGGAWTETLRDTGVAPDAPVEATLPIPEAHTGKVGRLVITASGGGCKARALSEASLVLPGPAPQVKRAKAPTNVLFWMIDNVRADRYKAYNPGTRVKTPVMDELVRTGTLFEQAYIQGTESRVSHGSIWTGLYPKQARFIDPKAKLSSSWVTLPEAVHKKGLFTAAWIANGFISKFWGFSEGWDLFRNTLHSGGGLTGERLADNAIGFIKDKGGSPFYLYVGTIDPHVSWRGRDPWLKEYSPEPYSGPFTRNVMGTDAEKIATGARRISDADRKRIIAIYDSTVSYNDQQLGRVLKALEERGIRQETMVVITADHGEELWDYGRLGHGNTCRDTLVAVPYIIHYPPLFGAGVRVRQGVDVTSVMPTILDALGAEVPEQVQGESLLPLAQGVGRGYPRPAFATQYEFAHTLRLESWKIRVGGKGDARLYDMSKPHPEKDDVAGKHPLETRMLTDALSTFMTYQSRWRALRWGVATNLKAAFSADLEGGKAPKAIRP